MGTKTSQGCIYALRDTTIISKFPDTIKRENLVEPSQKQAENFIHNKLKPKLLIKSTFNFGALLNWVNQNSILPVEPREPYCIDSLFNINDIIPSASSFSVFISTKHFLSLLKLTYHVCTDTTHKVIK